MTRLARTAVRLADGSTAVARRLGERLAAWVARGRRDDLTGWRAALGCWLRLAVLTLGLYLLWRLVRAVPNLMWLITGAWTIAAWRAGKAATEAEEQPTEATDTAPLQYTDADPHALLIHWLDHLTRGRAGIHLDELHQTLTAHPDLTGLSRFQMRAWLDRHHITVDRTLRVGSVAGRSGISRATIEALLTALSHGTESSHSPAPVHASDQHDSTVESGVESGVEDVVDPHFDAVARLFA